MCLASGHCPSTPPASSAYLSGALPSREPSSPQSSSGPASPGLPSQFSMELLVPELPAASWMPCHILVPPQGSLWHEALTIVLWNLAPWFL